MRIFPGTQFDIFIYVFHLIYFKENPMCDMEVNCLFQPALIFNIYRDKKYVQATYCLKLHFLLFGMVVDNCPTDCEDEGKSTFENAFKKFRTATGEAA